MIIQKTLVIVKPNIIRNNLLGKVISKIEKYNFKITNIKMLILDKNQAEKFYSEHKKKEFFNELINFMISNYVVVMILKGRNVISKFRKFIGNTNPQKAKKNTIRFIFGESITKNAIHASDSLKSSDREINFFFNK